MAGLPSSDIRALGPKANYSEHLARLRQGVEAAGIRTRGDPIYSRYDAPFVPWFMRRNEIWLQVE